MSYHRKCCCTKLYVCIDDSSFIAAGDGVHRYDDDGTGPTTIWDTSNAKAREVAFDGAGVVYSRRQIGTKGQLHAISHDGATSQWTHTISDGPNNGATSNLCIRDGGVYFLYAGPSGDRIRKLNRSTGAVEWNYDVPNTVHSAWFHPDNAGNIWFLHGTGSAFAAMDLVTLDQATGTTLTVVAADVFTAATDPVISTTPIVVGEDFVIKRLDWLNTYGNGFNRDYLYRFDRTGAAVWTSADMGISSWTPYLYSPSTDRIYGSGGIAFVTPAGGSISWFNATTGVFDDGFDAPAASPVGMSQFQERSGGDLYTASGEYLYRSNPNTKADVWDHHVGASLGVADIATKCLCSTP